MQKFLSAVSISVFLIGAGLAVAAPPEACALVPQEEVTKIIGNDAPISSQQPTVERGGAKLSSCVYQQAGGAGNTGNLSITTLGSAAAAGERLKTYGEAITKAGGTVEVDTVAGVAAEFITSRGGTGQMYVVKGATLLGGGVGTRVGGKVTPLRDRARALVAAALSRL